MRVLVTGASGFLGQHLCRRLRENGDEVLGFSSKEVDLRSAGSLKKFTEKKFDKIYHLAAWTQAGDFCLKHPGEQWIINQQMNTNVLTWWLEEQPQAKLVSIGTSCSYDPELPLTEQNYLVGQPIESLYTYAMTKRMLLVGMQSLSKQFGLKYSCYVPSTLYGADYHTDGRQMHFIFDLIRKIISGKHRGTPVVLWGDGHQRRELVLVDDFVSALVALEPKVENDIVNIGAGEDKSIREFAGMICEIVGFDFAKIEFDTSRYVGAKAKLLEVGKLKRLNGQSNFVPIAEGLRSTCAWFAKNPQIW